MSASFEAVLKSGRSSRMRLAMSCWSSTGWCTSVDITYPAVSVSFWAWRSLSCHGFGTYGGTSGCSSK